MSQGHVADRPGETLSPSPHGRSVDVVRGECADPVRCLLSVDPRLSRSVQEAVLSVSGEWRVSEVVDGLDAVYLGDSRPFDLLVLDLRLPVLDGYSAAARICAASVARGLAVPAVILVVDAVHELPASPSILGTQLRVLFRDSPIELVRSALGWAADRVHSRANVVRLESAHRDDSIGSRAEGAHSRPWMGLLSARERQVLVSLCMGQSNRQLASALSVSEATVKTHVSHLLAKLRVTSRVEAVVFAYENGIVVPGKRCRSA